MRALSAADAIAKRGMQTNRFQLQLIMKCICCKCESELKQRLRYKVVAFAACFINSPITIACLRVHNGYETETKKNEE